MPSQVSGLAGYNFYLYDGTTYTKLNSTPVGENVPFTASDLLSNTDYRNKLYVTAVDVAGNETSKVAYTDTATKTLNPDPSSSPLPSGDQAAIDAIVARCIAKGCGPGVTLSIASPRGTYTKTYGSDTGNDSHFRIASQTKSMIATVVLRAVDAGLLSLSDHLSTYLSGYAVDPTVQQMLEMRSGIYDYEHNGSLATGFTLNPTMAYTSDQVFGVIKAGTADRSDASEFAPGATFFYTNSNYFLLAKIVETVDPTHRTIDQILAQDVFAPLGMVNTYFQTVTGAPISPYSKGYDFNPILAAIGIKVKRDVSKQNPVIVGPAGAVISVISDMVLWGKELRDGTLLSPTIKALRDSTFSSSVPILPAKRYGLSLDGADHYEYGLGIFRIGSWLGHDGSWLGHDSTTMYEPSSGTVITVYENFQTPYLLTLTLLWNDIANYLLPASASFSNYTTRQQVSATMPKMGTAALTTLPAPYTDTNLDRTNSPVPLDPSSLTAGCWVTLRGGDGGGATGLGKLNQTGGGGGSGGAFIERYWIPVSLLGTTCSMQRGRGGGANQDGTDSVFSSGSISLTAKGGKKGATAVASFNGNTGQSVGGTWASVGLTGVVGHNGGNGGASTMRDGLPGDSVSTGAGAGGGGGGGAGGTSQNLGGAAGVGTGGNAGTGGDSGDGYKVAGNPGTAGVFGGGGGGGGSNGGDPGIGGTGSDGTVTVEWVA